MDAAAVCVFLLLRFASAYISASVAFSRVRLIYLPSSLPSPRSRLRRLPLLPAVALCQPNKTAPNKKSLGKTTTSKSTSRKTAFHLRDDKLHSLGVNFSAPLIVLCACARVALQRLAFGKRNRFLPSKIRKIDHFELMFLRRKKTFFLLRG